MSIIDQLLKNISDEDKKSAVAGEVSLSKTELENSQKEASQQEFEGPEGNYNDPNMPKGDYDDMPGNEPIDDYTEFFKSKQFNTARQKSCPI